MYSIEVTNKNGYIFKTQIESAARAHDVIMSYGFTHGNALIAVQNNPIIYIPISEISSVKCEINIEDLRKAAEEEKQTAYRKHAEAYPQANAASGQIIGSRGIL